MRRFQSFIVAGILILAVPTTGWSKGPNFRIEIVGDGLSTPIVITDPDILNRFNIWNGPGVSVSGPDGVRYPPAHLDPSRTAGRFIDWPRGMVAERPSGLQRLEVTFFLSIPRGPGGERSYIFAYEVNTSDLRGFIYLPLWMNSLIAHHVEGNWFYATEHWNKAIAPIVAAQTIDLPPPSERGNLNCLAGQGSISEDGTTEFMLFNEDGIKISHWRYETSSDNYEWIREHIGDAEPGDEIEVSCWPPRS